MKIVPIFAERLFAFQYENEQPNEYDRLLKLWNDTEYVHSFLKENEKDLPSGKTINQMAIAIIEDSYLIDDTLIAISEKPNEPIDEFFSPLYPREYRLQTLSLQKGRKHYLRLYAIRIAKDCFVITGGAIKLTQRMQEREHTAIELRKLEKARDFLKSHGVFDEDSFFELLMEQ